MTKSTILYEKALAWVERKGYNDVRINSEMEGYEKPSGFSQKQKEEEYVIIPDITGTQLGGKYYFEIVQKQKDVIALVSRWKLLSTMARIKKGELYLLAPKGYKKYATDIVDKRKLEARIVTLA